MKLALKSSKKTEKNSSNELIKVENLSHKYHSNYLFKNISFSISKGDAVAITGPNGVGKSTLIKVLLNLIDKQEGKIKITDKIGYIPQKFNQDVNFPAKVSEILNLECCACGNRTKILKGLGISDLMEKQFKDLSGGQQQRVLIALSMLSSPELLILDEPTVGVDEKSLKEFYELLKYLNETRGMTILFVTHDMLYIEKYFTKVLCIHDNHVHIDDIKKLNKNNNYVFNHNNLARGN